MEREVRKKKGKKREMEGREGKDKNGSEGKSKGSGSKEE